MASYTYKKETREVATSLLGRTTRQVTRFVIRDDQGAQYGNVPRDWTEEDVAAAVAQLNEQEQACEQLRAALGEEAYLRYLDDNEAG